MSHKIAATVANTISLGKAQFWPVANGRGKPGATPFLNMVLEADNEVIGIAHNETLFWAVCGF